MGYTSLFQSKNYADIHINVIKDLSGDIVSQVEDYEKLDEDLNTRLFASSKIELDTEEVFADDDDEDSDEQATDEEIQIAESQVSL